MIELRDMQLMVALAQHGHFARAAAECGISQPAFSMRIRNLEEKLGVAIVKRGNRFQGFTQQGELFLDRAKRLLDDARALEQELSNVQGAISGTLTLGVVPTALAFASEISARLHAAYPGIVACILSRTSRQILQGLEDKTLDAGLTYSDSVVRDGPQALHLYDESYVLVAPDALVPGDQGTVTWEEAAALPLVLLEPEMQNRRILDRQFAAIGQQPEVVAETNAFTACQAMVSQGFAATILPETLAGAIGKQPGTQHLPLVSPRLLNPICLVTPREARGLPALDALQRVIDSGLSRSR